MPDSKLPPIVADLRDYVRSEIDYANRHRFDKKDSWFTQQRDEALARLASHWDLEEIVDVPRPTKAQASRVLNALASANISLAQASRMNDEMLLLEEGIGEGGVELIRAHCAGYINFYDILRPDDEIVADDAIGDPLGRIARATVDAANDFMRPGATRPRDIYLPGKTVPNRWSAFSYDELKSLASALGFDWHEDTDKMWRELDQELQRRTSATNLSQPDSGGSQPK